jgi:hypothetical protein
MNAQGLPQVLLFFRQKFTLEGAIGSHAFALLEALAGV